MDRQQQFDHNKKTAIVLLNLGGPDRPESVGPFLRNFFNDPAIISVPQPLRGFIAWMIERKRTPVAQEIYRHLGGGSPLLPNSRAQADALSQNLSACYPDQDISVFVCMRYWHPMSDEIVAKVQEYGAEQVILLPLYPQFSTTTSGSSFSAWKAACQKQQFDVPTFKCGCYPENEGFVSAYATEIHQTLTEFLAAHPKTSLSEIRLLFSAHGLPEKIIEKGDPYQHHVELSCQKIMKKLADDYQMNPDHVICYQSRVGPMKWIGPETEAEIIRAGQDQKGVCLVPVAFVSEHSETLVELDIEYAELAAEHQTEPYLRVSTPGCHPDFIQGLAQQISLIMQDAPPHQKLCHQGQKCACY